LSGTDDRQKARTVCTIGTQPVIPAVYGVKAPLTSLNDLRLTLRHAGRAKAFYASAVLTLALGMAGATVMFTLVRGILLRPLPVPDEDRLVVSWRVSLDSTGGLVA
jgi:hypothetical protein